MYEVTFKTTTSKFNKFGRFSRYFAHKAPACRWARTLLRQPSTIVVQVWQCEQAAILVYEKKRDVNG